MSVAEESLSLEDKTDHIAMENEQLKNKWSRDSGSTLQRMQVGST